jgi:hypothetical protein
MNAVWMIFLVLIVFFLVLLFSPKDEYLESFKPMVQKILVESKQNPLKEIQFRKSKDKSYTLDKQKIYMVTERENGQKYNQDTILFVLLHEVAHIISPDEHHTIKFFEIEKKLHKKAIELGFLKISKVEKDYPCAK